MSEQKLRKPDRTDWHQLWGLMMSPLFERLGCETSVEVEFSSKSQRLDMAVLRKDRRKLCYDEVNPDYYEGFENLNEHNLITFKSFNEVFNMTALEEFYGYCISYRKLRNIGERKKHRISLYAVTYHSPDTLLTRFGGTPFLRCVREGRI